MALPRSQARPRRPEVYAELLRSYDEGVAEFLDLDRVKPNTLGNTRMLLANVSEREPARSAVSGGLIASPASLPAWGAAQASRAGPAKVVFMLEGTAAR